MEIELKLLQEKVNRLEEALNYVEAETSQKIRVLAEMITNRAELAQYQRKGLEQEEDFCQHLLTRCNWTSFADQKAGVTNNGKKDSILLQTLERKQHRNHDSSSEPKIESNNVRRSSNCSDKKVENSTDSLPVHRTQSQRKFSSGSSEAFQGSDLSTSSGNRGCPDPLSVVSLDFGNSDPSSLTMEYDNHERAAPNADTAENLIANNPNISVTLNTTPSTPQPYEIASVEFQQRYYVGGQVVEEVEQMQTLQSEEPSIQYSTDWNITSKECGPVEVDLNESMTEAGHYSNNQGPFTRSKPQSLHHPNPTYVRHNQQQSYGSNACAPRSKKQNKCKLCPAAFTLRRTLFMHMMTFHKTPQSQLPIQFQSIKPASAPTDHLPEGSTYDGASKPQKRLFCKYPHCQKSYASTQNLKIHMRTHTGERPHVCSLCQKAFADPSCLRRHTMFYHGVANNGNSTYSTSYT